MPTSLISSFILYCTVTAITPGPANLCSLAAAMKYGKNIALRQWRGLFTGYAVVALLSSVIVWFLGSMLDDYLQVLTWIGAIYILWLAWHIYRSDNSGSQKDSNSESYCNFFTGFFLQLTNAKIIISCITALTIYALPYAENYFDVLKIAIILPFTGPIANLVWLFAGASLQKFFRDYQKPVNILMALSLVFCAVNIVLH